MFFLLGRHLDKIFMRSGCSSRKGFDSKRCKMEKLKQASTEEQRTRRKKEIKEKREKEESYCILEKKKEVEIMHKEIQMKEQMIR